MTPTTQWAMALLLATVGISGVHATGAHAGAAVYQCKGDVFQDHPCDGAVGAAPAPLTAPARPAYDKQALERELDRLQALGVGMIQRTLPKAQPPRVAPVPKANDFFKPQPPLSYMQREAREQAISARLLAQTEHHNAVSVVKLSQFIEQQERQCGGPLAELPTVGMSDETFRQCTMLARFGEIDQIVVSEANGVPLRLYVFPTAKVRRVYSIDGVVTAIKP
jgi:hypothetical protein